MISIIIPVYNVEKYLKRCVESVCTQTMEDLEILLVDDGSTDSSGELCEQLARQDRRIRVIHKKNGGISDARNTGLKIAKGEYIGFVDSDDWIEPTMYEELLTAVKGSGALLATTGMNRFYESGYNANQFVCEHETILEGQEILRHYLIQDIISTAAWDKLYDRRLFDKRCFPIGKLFEDTPVIFDILCEIDKVAVLGKPHYHYLQRANGICGSVFSHKKMDHFEFSQEVYVRVCRDFPELKHYADAFWASRLCEMIYMISESANRKEFVNEMHLVRREYHKVAHAILAKPHAPKLIHIKALLAVLHLDHFYVVAKSKIAKRS